MENTAMIESTGDIRDLDATDQLPVYGTPKPYPRCYICNTQLSALFYDGRELKTGVYTENAILGNGSYYKDNRGRTWNIIHLSGITRLNSPDHRFSTLQAPWDGNKGIVRPEVWEGSRMYRAHLATALLQQPTRPLGHANRLMALPVHARCWQVLRTHRVWALAGGDMGILLRALHRRAASFWNWYFSAPDEEIGEYDDETGLMNSATGMDSLSPTPHPFVCKRTRAMVEEARARGKAYTPVQAAASTRLARLPAEVLRLLVDMLPSKDVAAVEDAMGLYLGNAFWRARIPALFHETRDLSLDRKELDWRWLCIALEELEAQEGDKDDDDKNYQLEGRRYVLRQLDQIAGFVAGDGDGVGDCANMSN
ncbi:uncharacterized protein DSM5745_07181 [Aspergillus mulundensis]|uniref:F-box domain-containing protein n=1 Tax=Aspergillus mulundensis TaxID=1810919 RepID=A0A3D8RKD9_9EURO|nr:hypothetical protein DSM5745_07181 [Aspergillus mulundensis]RDW74519.1 hypothetical protein DSM5745_07181 [Aspergillus mulundensis]